MKTFTAISTKAKIITCPSYDPNPIFKCTLCYQLMLRANFIQVCLLCFREEVECVWRLAEYLQWKYKPATPGYFNVYLKYLIIARFAIC